MAVSYRVEDREAIPVDPGLQSLFLHPNNLRAKVQFFCHKTDDSSIILWFCAVSSQGIGEKDLYIPKVECMPLILLMDTANLADVAWCIRKRKL